MKILEVTEAAALKAYNAADNAGKKLLSNLYGEKIFTPKSIWERLQTFEDSCEMDGVNPADILRFANPKNAWEVAKNTEDMLEQLYKMAVGDYEPNWDDSNERKHYPVFKMGAGFGFYYSFYVWSNTITVGGPRLYYFPTAQMAEAFGRRFEPLFKRVLNKPKRN
jgi:hypothetical protein